MENTKDWDSLAKQTRKKPSDNILVKYQYQYLLLYSIDYSDLD